MIARHHLPRALTILGDAGYRRLAPPFRAKWEQRYAKDLPLIGEVRVEVDVHVGLVSGYFGVRMDTAPLLANTVDVDIGAVRFSAFDAAGRLIHAAIHSAGGSAVALASAADIAMISGAAAYDHKAFVERVAQTWCAPIVARGALRTWTAFELADNELSSWARSVDIQPREEAALASLTRPEGESRWATGVTALPWYRRPGYLLPLLVPSREFLDHRGRTRIDHITHSLQRLRRGGTGR